MESSKQRHTSGRLPLLIGGTLSILAGLLHVLVIIGGSAWYRYFGAGEEMAVLAESGSLLPAFVTALITLILIVWGLYAFSGAGIIRNLPKMKVVLLLIGIIFTLRGVGVLPQVFMFVIPGQDVLLKDIVFSLLSLIIGISYLLGYQRIFKSRK